MPKPTDPIVLDPDNPYSYVDFVAQFDPVMAGELAVGLYETLERERF